MDLATKRFDYIEFLKSKISIAPETGFDVSPNEINPILSPHQRDAVIWAIRGGRRALFESFGLGKTAQQVEIHRIIISRESGKALIVAPLEVRHEFIRDAMFSGEQWEARAQEMGIEIDEIRAYYGVEVQYVRTMAEVKACEADIMITNYERVRDGDIDPAWFTAASLDEASVLRGYGTKTYQEFLRKFAGVRYKYVCTATPSPNRYKELIHYAGFLEVMDTGQALTRFFKRDSTQANNLTLYPHKEEEFWLWMSTWALFITKPSDLGYSDEGYDLPPMRVVYHEIPVDHGAAGAEDDGQGKLFRDAALGLKDASREKRDSIERRVEKMLEIIGEAPDEHCIIWHDLEDERRAIKRALPEAREIYGSQDEEERARNSIDFAEGRIRFLATKPEISGSGCNFQRHCAKAIFLGIGYKFNDFIQAIHRIYRFLQTRSVEIHVLYMESERAILDVLKKKWDQHNYLVSQMTGIVRRYGLSSTNAQEKLARTLVMKREEAAGERFTAVYRDNVFELQELDDCTVDLILTSVPFSNHYEYTATYNDFGHNEDNAAFFAQMDFLTPELLRVLRPGRVCAVHVKDRILFGNATGTGMPTLDPFSDLTTAHFMRHGFQFFGRITVVTDVVRENNQTYRLGWTECTKDGTKMGVGCPEYILLFRKLPSDTSKAYADTPVTKSKEEYTRAQWQIDAHAFWRSSGDRLLTSDELRQAPISELQRVYLDQSRRSVYDYRGHVELAKALEADEHLPASFMVVAPGSWHPDVWDDVNRMRTLNGEQARKELEMHICPLQFDIVERIINRYSSRGELVLDPFGGLMTVPYVAVRMGRRGYGVELNRESWKDGVGYLKAAELEVAAPTLFDLVAGEAV